ncbi:MAG: DUF6186 family protein [Paeniglutamicibacter sp.]
MTRGIAITGYLLVPVLGLVLFLLPRRWPDSWVPLSGITGMLWENRAARLTLVLFCWWFGWHFLMDG